jgi:hypothetical protein
MLGYKAKGEEEMASWRTSDSSRAHTFSFSSSQNQQRRDLMPLIVDEDPRNRITHA